MKASELRDELQAAIDTNGDLEVVTEVEEPVTGVEFNEDMPGPAVFVLTIEYR